MNNYHILLVRHMPNTNRVRIRSDRFEQTIHTPYTNDPGEHINALEEAKKWCEKNGHPVIGQGELKDDYVLIVDAINGSFKPLKSL